MERGRNGEVDGREPIPRLDELLSAWPEIRWNIDCKADRAVDPLSLELQRANALPRVCVSAFSDRRLFRLRYRLGSGLCSSAGPAELTALLPRLDLAGAVGGSGAGAAGPGDRRRPALRRAGSPAGHPGPRVDDR